MLCSLRSKLLRLQAEMSCARTDQVCEISGIDTSCSDFPLAEGCYGQGKSDIICPIRYRRPFRTPCPQFRIAAPTPIPFALHALFLLPESVQERIQDFKDEHPIQHSMLDVRCSMFIRFRAAVYRIDTTGLNAGVIHCHSGLIAHSLAHT